MAKQLVTFTAQIVIEMDVPKRTTEEGYVLPEDQLTLRDAKRMMEDGAFSTLQFVMPLLASEPTIIIKE